jgi:hypothetical protein
MVFIHLLSLFASLPSVNPKSAIRLLCANDRFGLKRITITITQLPLPLPQRAFHPAHKNKHPQHLADGVLRIVA